MRSPLYKIFWGLRLTYLPGIVVVRPHLASIGKEVSSSSEYREVSSHLASISEVVGNVYLVKEG